MIMDEGRSPEPAEPQFVQGWIHGNGIKVYRAAHLQLSQTVCLPSPLVFTTGLLSHPAAVATGLGDPVAVENDCAVAQCVAEPPSKQSDLLFHLQRQHRSFPLNNMRGRLGRWSSRYCSYLEMMLEYIVLCEVQVM
jgi:hypothetical protein